MRYITPYNCREREMRLAVQKYLDILLHDEALKECLPASPSITFKRAKNLKDMLVKSHHVGISLGKLFGSKVPKWGYRLCG